MNLFISVVNHAHDEMIVTNPTLASLAKQFKVIVKSNTVVSDKLFAYCLEHGITLIQGDTAKGFGANNNEVFNYVDKKLSIRDQDYFLVLNPDVFIERDELEKLLLLVQRYNSLISTINLYKNKEMTIYDNSIRRYPSLTNILKAALGIKRNDIYKKDNIKSPINVDWAAGSFLLFKSITYKKLQGFDEDFYMYFEDVDLCKRARIQKIPVVYYPNCKAVHLAMHANRNILSRSFTHYVKSAITYFTRCLYYYK